MDDPYLQYWMKYSNQYRLEVNYVSLILEVFQGQRLARHS